MGSMYPGEFDDAPRVLLGRWLQVVDLAKLGPDVPVRLLPRQLVLDVVSRVAALLVPVLALDLQHVGDVHLVRL